MPTDIFKLAQCFDDIFKIAVHETQLKKDVENYPLPPNLPGNPIRPVLLHVDGSPQLPLLFPSEFLSFTNMLLYINH